MLWEYRKAITQRKQFSTPRKSNPGTVLLTGRNPQNYFYPCRVMKPSEDLVYK